MPKNRKHPYRQEARQAGVQVGSVQLGPGRGPEPYSIKKRERKAARRELREQGYRGPSLRAGMEAWKRKQRRAFRQDIKAGQETGISPSGIAAVRPGRATKGRRSALQEEQRFWRRGAEKTPNIRLGNYETAKKTFGYAEPGQRYQEGLVGNYEQAQANPEYFEPSLRLGNRGGYDRFQQYAGEATPEVAYMRERNRVLGGADDLQGLSDYALQRLREGGLTNREEAAIRGAGKEAIEGSTAEGMRLAGAGLSSAGIDPRSGIAAQRQLQLLRGRQGELAGLERYITGQDLARKQQIENLGLGVAGLEESARGRDLAAWLGRRGQYESMLGGAGRLSEAGRQFDVGAEQRRRANIEAQMAAQRGQAEQEWQNALEYAEASRQAQKQRRQWKRAAKAMEPTGWEKAGAIMGGLGGLMGGAGSLMG